MTAATATQDIATSVLRSARAIAETAAAVNRRDRHLREALAITGVTPTGMHILAALALADRPVTAGEIATETRQSAGNVTKNLDRLERGGLAVRTHPPTDRRVVTVAITHLGSDIFAVAAGVYLEAVAS